MIHLQIVLFEDSHARGLLFKPLTYTRPFAELLVGCYSAIERILTLAPSESRVVLHVRPELVSIARKRYPQHPVNELLPAEKTVFVNARLLLTEYLFTQFSSASNSLFRWEDQPEEILGFNIAGAIAENISGRIASGEALTNED